LILIVRPQNKKLCLGPKTGLNSKIKKTVFNNKIQKTVITVKCVWVEIMQVVLMVDTFCSPVNVIQGIQLILEHNIHSQHLLELI